MKIFYLYTISLLFSFLVPSKTSVSSPKNKNNCTVETAQEEQNKVLALEFYQKLFGDQDLSAIDEYLGDPYIQHNPFVEDGKDGLRKAFPDLTRSRQRGRVDFRRAGADEDLVWIHSRIGINGIDNAYIDIYRFLDGKIVEHWDVIQVVPEQSRNNNTMF